MEAIRRQYYLALSLFLLFLYVLCIGVSFWALNDAQKLYASQTYNQIYGIKKTYLRDTVQNMVRNIDRIRANNRSIAAAHIEELGQILGRLYEISPDSFAMESQKLLHYPENANLLNILFEYPGSRNVLYENGEIEETGKKLFTEEFHFGPYRLRLGVNEKWVDRETKASISTIIHSQTFEDDGYIWVNEILDWNGGANYAIRRIHPNLISTEGSFLSTSMTDIKGNTPYLKELEGVRNNGELFYTYYFKRKDSSEIAEKLTYATVYRDYNWIVAMGVYLEDVQTHIDAVQNTSRTLMMQIIASESISLGLLFLVALFILSRMEGWYLLRKSNELREESNTDPLTGALNRRVGLNIIRESFKRFYRGLDDPTFFSFDIDNFKKVNDSYGHDAGDAVLRAICDQIRLNMRCTDRFFRWGGEEFILMCYGVDHDHALFLAEKLNRAISLMPIVIGKTDETPTCNFDLEACAFMACGMSDRFNHVCIDRDGDKIIHVSISIGVSWFHKTDSEPEIALKRADYAMYQAKAEGKNCSRLG